MIIDAHQHFWKLSRSDYGWLTPKLAPIYRDYLPSDMEALLSTAGVSRTVLVQAAPTVAETEFLLQLASKHDFIAGVAGWVDMAAPQAPNELNRLAANPWLKSIRPMLQDIQNPAWILKPELAPCFEALLTSGLCFDALVLPKHLEHLHVLLSRYPDLPVVIDHGAKPNIADGEFGQWADDIQKIAEDSDTCCKLSGLLTEAGSNNHPDNLFPYMQHLLNCFGPERLLWGSDWPVLNLASDYHSWITTVREFIAPLNQRQQAMIMGDNANRFYQLNSGSSL